MPAIKVAGAIWLSGAVVVAGAAGMGVYQLAGSSASTAQTNPAPTATASSGAFGGGTISGGTSNNGNGNSNPGHPITLSGAVTGTIRPGSPATLNVTIDNPNNQDVTVTSVTGSITSVTTGTRPGIAACNASWFHVGAFTGAKTIAKNKSGVVSVPVSLDNLNLNQDNCKGVTVQFTFSAQAQQA